MPPRPAWLDGVARPALCGTAEGRIAILDLPLEYQPAAVTLGFSRLSSLPKATKVACN